MINFPAPVEPPMIATIRLGTIAKHRVSKFRSHGLSRRSRKPCEENIKNKLKRTGQDIKCKEAYDDIYHLSIN